MKKAFSLLVLFSLVCASCVVTPTPPPATAAPTPAAPATIGPTLAAPATALPAPTASPSPAFTLTPAVSPIAPTPTSTPFPQASFGTLAPIRAGVQVSLAFLQMVDSSTGWGVDATGHILRTADSGATWQDITPPQGAFDRSGFFALDAKNAWATPWLWCGTNLSSCQGEDQPVNAALVWHTSDGGLSWQPSQTFWLTAPSDSAQMAYWPHLFFLNANTGWNIAWVSANQAGQISEQLFKTSDGGASWQLQADQAALQKSLTGAVSSFVFVDTQTGWAVINSSAVQPAGLYKTGDGGQSWSLAPVPNLDKLSGASNSNCTLAPAYGTTSASALALTCSAAKGLYFYDLSSDAGQTWRSWDASIGQRFYDAQNGWRLTAASNGSQYWLQHTADGGNTWQTLKTVSWQDAQFNFVDPQTGLAIVSIGAVSALLRTADGGKTWQQLKPLASAVLAAWRINLSDIHMVTEQSGWAAANLPDGTTLLLYTSDGAQTWQEVSPALLAGLPFNSTYLNENVAWAYNQYSANTQTNPTNLLRTSDGGLTWQVITHSLPQDLLAAPEITFSSLKEGWAELAGGGAGQVHFQVFTTQNGGLSWSQAPLLDPDADPSETPGTLNLCNICGDNFYYDATRQFITYGDLANEPSGKVRAAISFDQGKTWKALDLPFPSAQYADALVSPQEPLFFNQNQGLLPVGLEKFNPDNTFAYQVLALYTTQDGGLSWTPILQVLENVSGLMAGQVLQLVSPPGLAWAACGADLCATTDGAQTWQALHANLNFKSLDPDNPFVAQYHFTSATVGWASLIDGNNNYSLWKSTDGGHTWVKLQSTLIRK
ncbi:MAG: YCF48-related protein [Anaerolineaceae bacterium]|nr:YCF48-related protein [Anaerolineaceae bacterium]